MDRAEFNELYQSEYIRIRRICLGYAGGDDSIADELTQQVFIAVWEHLPKFRGDSQLGTWMYRIAVNTCLNYLRKVRRQREVRLEPEFLKDSGSEGGPSSETDHLQQRRLQWLYRMIQELTPMNRTIILLELEGLPQKEIASISGVSHTAVRTRLHRIKADLQKRMQHEKF